MQGHRVNPYALYFIFTLDIVKSLEKKERMMGNQIPPNIAEMIIGMLKGLNESDEFFETLASMMKKLYDALIKVGFTKKQAIRIVAGFAAQGKK
jgi:hypothetical protein